MLFYNETIKKYLMNNNTVSWHYAQNFDENEKRWQEMSNAIVAIIKVFSKNTLLQMLMMTQYLEILDMHIAISNGDRSEYLYKKAQETVEEAVRLEEAGNKLKDALLESKKLNNVS